MSHPYPPAPRKLQRSTTNKFIGGVCGGVADYLNMDATLVRVLTVLITLFTGVPVILYILALFLVPEEGKDQPPSYPGVNTGPASYGETYQQPPAAPTAQESTVWGSGGAPWEQQGQQAPKANGEPGNPLL